MRALKTNKNLTILLNVFLIASSFFLLLYTGYRSWHLSFTHDESYTYISYVHSSVIDIMTYNVNPKISNNHILNTLFMKWSENLFGTSEFTLRLHSVIAHIIYLLFSYLILKEAKSKYILFLGFMLLNFNPFLLDFFSLARGYALSIAFMMVSIYFFTQYIIKNQKDHFIALSLVFSLLAVLSHFVFITFVIAVILVLNFFLFAQKNNFKTLLLKNIPVYITLFILFLIYSGPIKVLVDCKQLSDGGNQGLWFDTAISSIHAYLYCTIYYDELLIFLRFVIVFVSISFVIVIYKQVKTNALHPFSYIALILFFILLFSFMQHLFLHGSFLKERFALFMVPLFFFTLLNTLSFLFLQKKAIKITAYTFTFMIITCSSIIFCSSVNLNYCASWRYDAHTRDMIDVLSDQAKPAGRQTTIGVTSLFEPTINFYRETRKLEWLKSVSRDGPLGNYDFYYLYYYPKEEDKVILDTIKKIRLVDYPISEASLYKSTITTN